ncbi:hypothetical protein ABZ837_39410 [Streptomyces sp. NPDC047197]|uniref:hypothetical protein n=1 Tax=Streptomyces sp. NPDC047197 TaxID=3155477 RepID=UPI0033F5B9A5
MSPADYPTAWQHPPTRGAWILLMVKNVAGLIGWIGVWFALIALPFDRDWVLWIFVPYSIYGSWRLFVQVFGYFPIAMRKLRILRAYPWQVLRGVSYGLTDYPDILGAQHGWFEFPNPANPQQQLPLVVSNHLRVGWWHRRMAPRAKPQLKARIETIWFAGDPRMLGIVAAPSPSGRTPGHFKILRQRLAMADQALTTEWGATAEDVERGRRAGFTPYVDPRKPKVKSL